MPEKKKKEFCGVPDWNVLIPYSDLQYLVNSLKNAEELQKQYEQMQKELIALRALWLETLEKIDEINRYL